MTVGGLVLPLLLGLLVSARCEVRARDPEVEEEEGEVLGGRGGGGAAFPPHPRLTKTPLLGERGSYPARTGNWCAFVQRRVVTSAVACGTEKYTIKSQGPCETVDCHLVMYKLSTRPVYRQKQLIVTTLQWRCCQGHRGQNCEDSVSEAQLEAESSTLIGGSETVTKEVQAKGARERLQLQSVDLNSEQNDHAMLRHHEPHPEPHVSIHVIMDLVMSKLQPVLAGFNHSLEQLSQQVGNLARDVDQLKSSRPGPELQAGPPDDPELEQAAEERLDAKLYDVFENIREVRRQMEHHRADMEFRLHSQHAMLHYNLTSFKTDVDMKLKRHQKMLQVSLQAMNATLAELKLDQDQDQDQFQDQDQDQVQDQTTEELLEDLLPPLLPLQPSDTAALWEAIERLDNMVVNNTVKVGGLMEDVDVVSGGVQQLRRDYKELKKQINQTARTSQIQFMETGLEVEAAKEAVLQRVGELAGNLSLQGERLQEMDVDVDYLYTVLYKHNTSTDCDCKVLKTAVARLERGVANVTELANENRLALEESSEGGAGQWDGASDWEPAVKALQHGLYLVNESLASEKNRTMTLDHSLTQLGSSVKVVLAEVLGLQDDNREELEERQHLSGSFNSLLKDATRHSDVLELLLGEEVLEFLEWQVQDQEAHSIPALKEQLGHLQEQLRGLNLSITSLLGNRAGDREEVPSADQPSSHRLPDDWHHSNMRRSSGGAPARERQLLLHPGRRHLEHRGDGSDLWNLEKRVEELGLKVLQLEEKPGNTSDLEAKLLAEVTWLKRGLEEHLRVFKNVFSNADVLVASDVTLELDKLWQLVKNKDGKKEKKRGGGGGGGGREEPGRGGTHRSRREVSGVLPVPPGPSERSLLLVAGPPLSFSDGAIMFKASLNQGGFYSDTGTFTAPVNGVYLFVLTLDLRPGPTHVVLSRWGTARVQVSLHRQEVTEAGPVSAVSLLPLMKGEEVRLELKGGQWAESEDNLFTVLLLDDRHHPFHESL